MYLGSCGRGKQTKPNWGDRVGVREGVERESPSVGGRVRKSGTCQDNEEKGIMRGNES